MRHEAAFGDRIVSTFEGRPGSVWSMFAAAALRTPQAEAVVCETQRLSYADCESAAATVAAGFAAQGVQPGDRVVLFIDNRPEFVLAFLALQRLGAIAVPVGVREQRPGLAWIAQQCGAVAVVADAALVDRLPLASEAPDLRLRISVGDATSAPGCLSWATLAACTDAPPPGATPAEHAVAVILYTSGTTGHPKGAMLTHSNIVHSVLHYQACMRLGSSGLGERAALAVPASHVTGLVAIIATMLHLGGAIV
ncbi:MAG: O-succinylbenzoic acid--CoA ligase, partial [Burkholderiales bacterium PBB5]